MQVTREFPVNMFEEFLGKFVNINDQGYSSNVEFLILV